MYVYVFVSEERIMPIDNLFWLWSVLKISFSDLTVCCFNGLHENLCHVLSKGSLWEQVKER